MDTMTTSDPVSAPSVASYSQVSFAAIRRSNEMTAAAYKEFGDLVARTVHSHVDQTMSACQALVKAESLKDALTIQTDYMRAYSQTAWAGTSEIFQASNRLANEAVASMTARLKRAGGADA